MNINYLFRVNSSFFKYLGFIFFISFKPVFSQDILPFIENYSKQDYKGDNQIWSLTQGSDNAIYFANNYYFLRYNGVKWEKYSMPNKTPIKSIFSYKDRIYTGSYNEFGYWTRVKGEMNYTSLVPNKNFFGETRSEDVWKIFEWNGKIYFQTFNEIYVYNFKTIERLLLPRMISYSFVVDNRFLVATVDDGIYELLGNHYVPVEKWSSLKGKIVHGIEKIGQKIYFFTQKDGVFVYENNELIPWNHPLQEELKKELINSAKLLDNKRLAIGTASNGLYIINLEKNTYFTINRNVSLQNNSVLSIALDKENDLWLGLDNGIAHIEINSPYSFFTDKSGILGSVYAISNSENGYLLGSNHGLFKYENKKINLIENSQGQVWDIYKYDNQYVIGHNSGTYLYKDNKIVKSSLINGGWKFKKDLYRDSYIQANYTGLAFFDDINDLSKGVKLNKYTGPIKDFVQIAPYEIIAAHSNKGLFRIKYDKNYELIYIENLTQKSGIIHDYGVKIFQYKNEILFFINNEWYYLDKIDNKLKSHHLFNENFRDISEIIPIDDTGFAVVKKDILFIINQIDNKFTWSSIPSKLYSGRIINDESKIFYNEGKYLLNLDDGFLIINSIKNNFVKQNVIIEGYYNNKLIGDNKIPNNKTVHLDVISEFYGNNKSTLFYSVNNSAISPLLDGQLVLNNLSSGNYSVKIFSNDGYKSTLLSEFDFRVKMPWYASFSMIFIYIVLLLSTLLLYYRWNKIRFKEKLRLKEEEIKHKSELMQLEIESENKIKLQEYEKHILENQVHLKANELAGKSLSLAKQTELIESIQDILESENTIQSLKSKITKAIKTNRINKNEWKSFENNLLKSNEDFVKELTSKYENLTSKDIKLCIYLKMNLSSKEIAPLMNISYRGVELHRYRLRKKLGLDSEVNLNTFMNNL